ncbi:TorD/DmsD family molecular chaperone [Shewanella sp. 0m-11]
MVKATKEHLQQLQAIALILHNTLLSYPSEQSIQYFIDNQIAESWPVFNSTIEQQQGQLLLKRYCLQWKIEQINDVKLDYGQLFFGPGEPKAMPWGSVYLSEQQLINDESTVQLMQFYKQYQVTFALGYNQPVDHIALFYGVIAELLTQLINTEDNNLTTEVLLVLLQQHLLPWSGRCLTLAIEHSETDFYKGIALLALDFETQLIKAVNVVPMTKRLFK